MAAKKVMFECPVHFGDITIGEGTARVGILIDRKELTFTNAEKFFCGKRLLIELTARSTGEADQESLPGADQDVKFTTSFDVKGISLRPKRWGTGLTFIPEGGTIDGLAFVPKRSGKLRILEADVLPEKKRGRPAKALAVVGGKDDDDAEHDEHDDAE